MPAQTDNSKEQSTVTPGSFDIKVTGHRKKSRLIRQNAYLKTSADPLEPLALKILERLTPDRRTPEMETAFELYLLGLNVFPQPLAMKSGWPWKPLQYTRVHPMLLPVLFQKRCNIAIMTGRTSGNLFVLDCETKEVFEEQGHLLRKNNIPIYSAVTSGPEGGGHYYFRCANGEVANLRSSRKFPNFEVRGSRCYVIAPPSIHPQTGVHYRWDTRDTKNIPVIDIKQLNWLPLTLTNNKPISQDKYAVPSHNEEILANLSRKTIDFIYAGAPKGSRNNRLFAALCDMIGNDIDEYEVETLAGSAAERSGLDDREIRRTIRSAYSRHREPSRPPQPHVEEEPEEWQKALLWAYNRQWTGRTGQSDRATFLAMCERARMYSTTGGTFRASTRELAEIAQLRRATVSKAIQRLLAAGYIIGFGEDVDTRARMFRFGGNERGSLRKRTIDYHWSSGQWAAYVTFEFKNIFHSDAYERNALGKTAAYVWQRLLHHGKSMTPKMIAEMCKLNIHQVYRALKKLDKYKLAEKHNRRWKAIKASAEWLDEHVAAPAGTKGRMEARKAKHQVERAMFAGWDVLDLRDVEERKYYGQLVRKLERTLYEPIVEPAGRVDTDHHPPP